MDKLLEKILAFSRIMKRPYENERGQYTFKFYRLNPLTWIFLFLILLPLGLLSSGLSVLPEVYRDYKQIILTGKL